MSQLYPKTLFKSIEFDQVLADLAARCIGEQGKEKCLGIRPVDDRAQIIEGLEIAQEMRVLQRQFNRLPFAEYQALRPTLRMLRVQDAIPPSSGFLNIRNQLRQLKQWDLLLKDPELPSIPRMKTVLVVSDPLPEVAEQLEATFDDEGEVLDSASEELLRIRREIRHKFQSIDHAFNQEM
ncbi:MAG: hypothetical protein KTR24_08350, partial [Saprospiraceae bacterium]|nr:hypothetical protein [Saprospiraceae bacterium]